MTEFSYVIPTLASAMRSKGYERLTPVQEAVSEPALAGQDLLVSAQTGSGKTVGFGLAIAPDMLNDAGRFGPAGAPAALVIAPTRELAMQVKREFDWLFAEAEIVTASTVGGMDARSERRALERGAHVVVATPGRLRDHIMRGAVDLSALKAVVLDEADEMLDMGFSEDLEFILDHTPEDRRTLLFSATVPRGIAALAKRYQSESAQRIEVGGGGPQHADITYRALSVAPSDTENAIINLLRYYEAQTAIVFANTRAMVARLTARFSNRGFSVVSLSGELSQSERTHALQALRDGRARVCVATDVAARGIDLPNLELVIHADLPSNAETLLHRSGRTGRAGRKGISALIVPGRQKGKAERLLRFAKLQAEWALAPSADEVLARDEERMLADSSWTEELTESEASGVSKLLELFTPEQIAGAYLRLSRARLSAPEQLGEVTQGRERGKERAKKNNADFGPSSWFSLSLGRKQRAEPRWLLPMLCRNAGIAKDDIGAIRVQYQETFVEIRTSAVPALKAELGETLDLEQGARLTELQGMPDFDASPKGPPADHASKPERAGKRAPDRPEGSKPKQRKPKDYAPKAGGPKETRPKAEPAPSKPKRPAKPEQPIGPARRKGASDPSKPMGPRRARKAAMGKGKGKEGPGKTGGDKPARFKTRAGKGPEARPMRKGPPRG